MSERPLAGKHALVTGGSRGIGAVTARLLESYGAFVTVIGRQTTPLRADVGDSEAVKKAFKEASARWGPIHILVNNAGQAGSAPFLKTGPDLWSRMINVNLEGTVHCTRSALPGMLEEGWGRIVNVASTAGLTGYSYVTAYCAAKHAVVGFTRALALELAAKGITVNAVCPGFTDTDLLADTVANIAAKSGRSADEAKIELTARNPQKRLVRPEEVANAVAWLCLPGSEAITGQAIAVAGGEVM